MGTEHRSFFFTYQILYIVDNWLPTIFLSVENLSSIKNKFTKTAIFIQTVSWSHKQTRNLKEEKQPSMRHKSGSRLPALRMNGQDFSGLTNEISDLTDQSDKSLLCWWRIWSSLTEKCKCKKQDWSYSERNIYVLFQLISRKALPFFIVMLHRVV